MAASVTPYMRMMSNFPSGAHVTRSLPKRWTRVWQGQLTTEELHCVNAASFNSVDGIETDDVIEEDDD